MRYNHSILLSIVAFAAILCNPNAGFAASILGSADDFAVLAGSTVTNTGNSTINGDIGVWAGNTYTGAGTVIQTGSVYLGNGVAQTAQGDVTTAYNALAGMPVSIGGTLTGQDLGGLTLAPGVYKFASAALLTGTLTLDAQGFNNVSWVFQITSKLTTAPNAAVQFVNLGSNNGSDDGVFWQVGSSATLDIGTMFDGNILANQSIALNTGAALDGRALAQIAAVTMQGNTINSGIGFNGGLGFDGNGNIVPSGPQGPSAVPEPGSLLLIGFGMAILTAIKRRLC